MKIALLVNIVIRLSIFYFLGEVLLLPGDLRFAGKAIPIRNLVIVVGLSLLLPILFFWKKKGRRYPWWLDMAGNSFNFGIA